MSACGWRLRGATQADVDAMWEVERHTPGTTWTREALAQELGIAWSRVIVAARAQAGAGLPIEGLLIYWVVEGEAQIMTIGVHPSVRRKGLGRQLLASVLSSAASAHIDRVLLEVRRGNVPALALYRSLGFTDAGTRSRYYSDGEDALLLRWERGPWA